MKKWKCSVCGEIVESDVRPERCPLCKVPGEKFEEIVENGEMTWAAEHVVGVAKDAPMEMLQAGNSSHTDIVLCYMNNRVDHEYLDAIKTRIRNIQVDALTMNQESLAECLYKKKWYNPFPKFKYTERPDTAAAQILEGDIIILVDNSPSAMITPTSVFDIIEEADDYYFPPITGTYLRLSRMDSGRI